MNMNILTLVTSLLVSHAAGQSYCKDLGNTGLQDCGSSNDLIQTKEFSITPSVFTRGKENTFHLRANITKPIVEGATVKFSIKHNGKVLADGVTLDYCQHLKEKKSKIQCPIQPNELNIDDKIEIPSYAPAGVYEFTSVGTQGYQQIFNLKGKAEIH